MQRLGEHGYRPVSADLGHNRVLFGARRADFRSSWGFTRLHTFIVAHEVEVATADDIEELSERSTRYAVRNKGGLPRGFQTGVAVLPVLICRTAPDDAVAVAERQPRKRFATLVLPVLIDLSQQRIVTYHEPRFWGSLYQDFLGQQQRLVAGEFCGEVLPPGGEQRAQRWMVIGGVAGGVIGVISVLAILALMIP